MIYKDLGVEIQNLMEQTRGMRTEYKRLIDEAKSTSTQLTTSDTSSPVLNAILNYIRNSDISINDESYISATYAASGTGNDAAADVAAHIYQRASSDITAIIPSTSSVRSGDALSIDTASPSLDTYWIKGSGEIAWGSDKALYFPLRNPMATPGSSFIVKVIVKLKEGVDSIGTIRLKASIWDNTIPAIAEGTPFALSAVRNPNVHVGGLITRKYILKVITNYGFFYSNVDPSALNGGYVENTVSPLGFNETNFVVVQWTPFNEAIRYKLYRWDSEDVSGHWYMIADIFNSGGVIFDDKGGRPSTEVLTSAPSQINPSATSFYTNFGTILGTNLASYKEINFSLIVPSTYTLHDNQFLRLDAVDADGNTITLDDGVILIDKLALSYNRGIWTPSPDDSGFTIVSLTPNPTGSAGSTPTEQREKYTNPHQDLPL